MSEEVPEGTLATESWWDSAFGTRTVGRLGERIEYLLSRGTSSHAYIGKGCCWVQVGTEDVVAARVGSALVEGHLVWLSEGHGEHPVWEK